MKKTIPSDTKAFQCLNNLIIEEYYIGSISPIKFEMISTKRPRNYRIIGLLNHRNRFELKFDYVFPVTIAAKIALGLGILSSIIALIHKHWLFPIFFFILPFLLGWTWFVLKKNKEINLFIDRFLLRYENQ